MNKIRIVTDSTSYLSKKFIKENDITVVPLSVLFEGKSIDEGFVGEFDDFFHKLSKSDDFPKTSQPAIAKFIEVFESAVQAGEEVIAIMFSSELSGTYNTAVTASKFTKPEKISVIDSRTASYALESLIRLAVELRKEGKSRKEIVEIIEREKAKYSICLTVETLEYLKKGGRLSNAQAFLGSLLNIKPIIELTDGKLVATDKVRGAKKALKLMIDKIPNDVKEISIAHVCCYDKVLLIKEDLECKFPNAIISIGEIGIVVGSHLGVGAFGFCYK